MSWRKRNRRREIRDWRILQSPFLKIARLRIFLFVGPYRQLRLEIKKKSILRPIDRK